MAVTVLLIDDDDAFRARIGAVLIEHGYEIVGEATSVAQARDAIAELAPDALLLDVNLPDGNGIGFAAELAAAASPPRVLLTSNDPGAAPARLVRRCGARGFLAKSELLAADLGTHLG